ncbi:MAG: CopG family transcriptional regulator [Galactobacter sp.]
MPTTIKVPNELRDRINHEAQSRGTSAAGLIEELLAESARLHRMESFGQAIRSADRDYWNEFRAWDETNDAWDETNDDGPA